ncbi:MAG: hypothetical protein M9953_05385 [Thermomicrobiales bacterium]|nr:hypothetical protein [Thermomicrobiales bacterium]
MADMCHSGAGQRPSSTIQVTGPWVIKKAADHPLMLITIAGIGRGAWIVTTIA